MKTIQCPKCNNDELAQGSGQLDLIYGNVKTTPEPMYIFFCKKCGAKLYLNIQYGPYEGTIKNLSVGKLVDFVDTDKMSPSWSIMKDQYKSFIRIKKEV